MIFLFLALSLLQADNDFDLQAYFNDYISLVSQAEQEYLNGTEESYKQFESNAIVFLNKHVPEAIQQIHYYTCRILVLYDAAIRAKMFGKEFESSIITQSIHREVALLTATFKILTLIMESQNAK